MPKLETSRQRDEKREREMGGREGRLKRVDYEIHIKLRIELRGN